MIRDRLQMLLFFIKVPIVVGAIDSRENPIQKPYENAESYFNKKSFYSIKIQAVADHNTVFIDVFVGCTGRSHDGRAFVKIFLFQYINVSLDACIAASKKSKCLIIMQKKSMKSWTT